jgi:hypothetical protein
MARWSVRITSSSTASATSRSAPAASSLGSRPTPAPHPRRLRRPSRGQGDQADPRAASLMVGLQPPGRVVIPLLNTIWGLLARTSHGLRDGVGENKCLPTALLPGLGASTFGPVARSATARHPPQGQQPTHTPSDGDTGPTLLQPAGAGGAGAGGAESRPQRIPYSPGSHSSWQAGDPVGSLLRRRFITPFIEHERLALAATHWPLSASVGPRLAGHAQAGSAPSVPPASLIHSINKPPSELVLEVLPPHATLASAPPIPSTETTTRSSAAIAGATRIARTVTFCLTNTTGHVIAREVWWLKTHRTTVGQAGSCRCDRTGDAAKHSSRTMGWKSGPPFAANAEKHKC